MFKSVFIKYFLAFMLIVIICFTVLSAVLCSTVNDFAATERTDSLARVGNTVRSFIYTQYQNASESHNYSGLDDYIEKNRQTLRGVLYTIDVYTENIDVFITDTDGKIIIYSDNITTNRNSAPDIDAVPESILSSAFDEGVFAGKAVLDSSNQKYLVFAIPLKDSDLANTGAVFVCSSTYTIAGLNEKMIQTVIMSTMWIMLATMVAVYFLSERITSPLKHMNSAAKTFATGYFDIRVPVTGHDEISELAEAFNDMASALASNEESRRSFLANISHDLRTPMTTISGFIDGIIDGTIPLEKHDYYLDIIRNEVRRLSRLVSSLLDITRIQAGERKFVKSAFDICEMARVIIIGFEQKLEEKKLDVEFLCDHDKMFAYADRDAIYQILYNICDNAVKFSYNGGKYRVSIKEQNKKLRVSVYNEGQGISEADLPFVFDRFYKSDKSRGLDKTGLGLGMYIAKTIIDAHGESISVHSEYGKFCEFTFTLPCIHEAEIVKNC